MTRAAAAVHAKAHPHDKPHHPHWPLSALLFAFVFLLGLFSVHETATWLNIGTGGWILAHHAVPRVDIFSYTVAGRPWTTDSWLSDVLFFLVHRAAGPAGLIALKSLVLAAAFALLLPLNPASPLTAAAVLSLGAVSAWTGFTERPAMFDFLLLALMIRALRPRRLFHWSMVFSVAGIELAWANLHGRAAILGLVLIALKVFKTSLRTVRRERLNYLALLVVAWLALLCNPRGASVVTDIFHGFEASHAGWQPLSPWLNLYNLFALAGAAACLVTLQQEFFLTTATAVLLGLGLLFPDRRPLSLLAACPTIALALGHFIAPLDDSLERVAQLAGGMAVLFGLHWLSVYVPLASARGYGGASLSGAVDFLSSNGLQGRMFNEPESGAMLAGQGAGPVFSDQRAGLYGPDFMRDARRWPKLFGQLARIYEIDYAVILNRRAAYPARVIDDDPGWRLAYGDDEALVYTRVGGADSWAASGPHGVLRPNQLWPTSLDAPLADPALRMRAVAELDGWIIQVPDAVEPVLWKAYALDRLNMPRKGARMLALADKRPALWRDPELLACAGFVYEARGDLREARRRYLRASLLARRRGDAGLEAAILERLAGVDRALGNPRRAGQLGDRARALAAAAQAQE